MSKRTEMERQINPWDVLLGICFGAQFTVVVLRLAALVDVSVFVWGQLIGVLGNVLLIARFWHARSKNSNTLAD